MNIKRAKQEIKDTIEAYLLKDKYGNYKIPTIRQRPIFLVGAPGIGKTQIMEQIAAECKIGLVSYTITHHTRQSAIGLPFISKNIYDEKEYSVTEYTMSEIIASVYDQMELTGCKEGILFIDEINCVSETLAPAMLQFLQCKTFGAHSVPEGWLIVSAGNPPEYNKSVREFDVVTMDRVKKIEVEPEFSVWKEYANEKQIHPAIISYLSTKSGNFYHMERTVDGNYFATPRGWEDLSQLLQVYEETGKTVDREVVEQYIQYPKVAKDFANYLELFYSYETEYKITDVLEGKLDSNFAQKLSHASFDERYSVICLLLAKLTKDMSCISNTESLLSDLTELLRNCKSKFETQSGEAVIQEEINAIDLRIQKEKKAKLLQKDQEYALRALSEKLESFRKHILKQTQEQDIDAFEIVQEQFYREVELYNEQIEDAGKQLEYAFDFMEIAFGVSQEMTMFVNELNMNPYSLNFVQTYECQRYYQYNESLLFNERRNLLLKRIETVL